MVVSTSSVQNLKWKILLTSSQKKDVQVYSSPFYLLWFQVETTIFFTCLLTWPNQSSMTELPLTRPGCACVIKVAAFKVMEASAVATRRGEIRVGWKESRFGSVPNQGTKCCEKLEILGQVAERDPPQLKQKWRLFELSKFKKKWENTWEIYALHWILMNF